MNFPQSPYGSDLYEVQLSDVLSKNDRFYLLDGYTIYTNIYAVVMVLPADMPEPDFVNSLKLLKKLESTNNYFMFNETGDFLYRRGIWLEFFVVKPIDFLTLIHRQQVQATGRNTITRASR